MAEQQHAIKLKITGDNSAGPVLSSVIKDVQKLEKGVEDASKNIRGKLSEAFTSASATIAGVVTGAFAALTAVIVSGMDSAKQYEIQMKKLEGVIKATGGAAGLTADEVEKLVGTLAGQSLVPVGDIRDAAAKLLTFKSVTQDVFKTALALSVDLSATGFGDVSSAALMMGKALEDPEKGMTALRRAGVSLTEKEQDLVKSLVAVGKTAEAQQIVLSAVAGQVSGVAKSMGDTLEGSQTRLKKSLSASATALARAFIPVLKKVYDELNVFTKKWNESLSAKSIAAGLAKVASYIADILIGVLKVAFDLYTALDPVIAKLKPLAIAIGTVTAAMWLFNGGALVLIGTLKTFIAGVLTSLLAKLTFLISTLRALWVVMLANPIVAALAVIGGLAAAWFLLGGNAKDAGAKIKAGSDEAAEAQIRLSETYKELGDSATEASAQLEKALSEVGKELERLDKKIGEGQKALGDAQREELQGLKSQASEIKTAYAERLQSIEEGLSAQVEAIAQSGASEREVLQQTAESQRQASQERLSAMRDYEDQAITLVEQERTRRLTAAKAMGQDQRQIEIDILTAKRDVLRTIEGDYKKHIDALNAEAKRHYEAVKQIEDQIRGLKQSTEERIREIQRGGMTEYEAALDRRQQIAEMQAQAEAALAQGRYQEARDLAQKTADLATQNVGEVKEGDRVMIDGQQARAAAIQAVTSAQDIQIRSLEEEKRAHQETARAAEDSAGAQESALSSVSQQIEELTAKLNSETTLKLRFDEESVNAAITAVEALLAQKGLVAGIKVNLEAFGEELAKAGTLAKDKPIELQVSTEKAKASLEELIQYSESIGQDGIPLGVETTVALAAVNDVKTNIEALSTLKSQSTHTVESNVPAVAGEIDALNGRDTSSTHTIYVRKVETNAAGGLIQALAGGGSVFRLPGWSTVPGSGDQDSVPAGLPAGSFVLRKKAAQYYGALLRRLAGGGLVNTLLTPGERWFDPAAVRRIGAGMLYRLNSLSIPREALAMASGGMVSGGAPAAGGSDTVNIHLTLGAHQVRLQGARDQAAGLARALRELQRGL